MNDNDAGVEAEIAELENILSTDAEPSPDPIEELSEPFPKYDLRRPTTRTEP